MKKLLVVFFFILLGIVVNVSVTAGNKITLKNDKMITKNGWAVYQIKVDNKLAFCLEPGIISGTTSYKKQDYNKVYKKLSKSKKDKIKKIALFSEYLYNQSKKSSQYYYKYYYAGSELIWDVVTGKKYRFRKDLTSYRNKINKEVTDFNKFTKINKQTLSLKVNKNYVDKSDYYKYITLDNVKGFEQQAKMKVSLTSNQLAIQNNNNTDNKTYTLNYQKYAKALSKGTSYAYYNAYTQDYALIKDDSKLKGYVKVKSVLEYGQFDGYKVDNKQNKLANITFSYYQNNQKLGEVTTDEHGYFKSDQLLVGQYTLQEESNEHYLDNKQVYHIDIKANDTFHVNDNKPIVNVLKRGSLRLLKKNENQQPLANVLFQLYDSKMHKLSTHKSDTDGILRITDLVYGRYYLKEIKTLPQYRLSDKLIAVDIKDNSEVILADLINYYRKSHLTIYKKDRDNQEPIPKTQFKVNDQKYTTNQDGKIELDVDNKCYRVQEIKASAGYLLQKHAQKACFKQGESTLY